MTDPYLDFLARKTAPDIAAGIEPKALPSALKPFQHDITSWALRRGRAALFESTGLGKQQPLSEPVLTPTGWRPIGDLCIGSQVTGPDGLPRSVIGVFPQGRKPVYRLELADGSFSRAGAEHLWAVRTKSAKFKNHPFRVFSTQHIASTVHQDWQLPMFDPIAVPDSDLPIDPYTLGVALGDGTLCSRSMSACTDNWIGAAIGWHFSSPHLTCGYVGTWRAPKQFMLAIVNLGLSAARSDTKFIPSIYMLASPAQRLALLNGLMDTDGYPMGDGGAEFCSTSRAMFDSVCELTRSLGGIARGIRQAAATFQYKGELRQGKPAWRVNIKLPGGIPMFRLPRKAEIYRDPTKYQPNRIIRRVIKEGIEEDQVCIKVDAEDGLYVTRDHIVTHNTGQQLAWAEAVHRETKKLILVMTPLAVAEQTVLEAQKFNIDGVSYAADQDHALSPITVTNYDRAHLFDFDKFGGIVADESGILKAQDGAMRKDLTERTALIPYLLCCTATPAPNDWTEIGQHSEYLRVMRAKEMLAMYFVHDGSIRAGENASGDGWRLKGHAQRKFWEWVASWAVMIRSPADLGYDDAEYRLPPLTRHQITVAANQAPSDGMLFRTQASTLSERIGARRDTIKERVGAAAEIVNAQQDRPWLLWCDLNEEGDRLTRECKDAVQIAGKDSREDKVSRMLAFARGDIRVLVSKSRICGWGLNFQHCADMAFVGMNDSFEGQYQAIRRCWRYGQKKPVNAYMIASDIEGAVVANIERKERDFEAMQAAMAEHMIDLVRRNVRGGRNATSSFVGTQPMKLPEWISA